MPLQLHFPSISTYKTQPSILAARDAVLPSLSHGNEHPISKAKVDCVQSRVYDESSQMSSESDDQTDSEEESASETEDREVLYRELFGVSQPPEDSGDEALDEHERSSVLSLPVLSSGQASSTNTLQPIRPKRNVLPLNDNSNFSGTPLPSPLVANSISKGKPPVLLGRPSLKHTRATFGNVTYNESRPPKRRVENIDATSPGVEPFIANKPSDNHATRGSSSSSSRTSTSSSSCHTIPSILLPEDKEIVNQMGFPQVVAVIAKDYGFDVDVAKHVFFATKSIEKTKSVLQNAKEAANSAMSVLLAELVNQAKDDGANSHGDEELRRSMRRGRGSSSSGKDKSSSSGHQKTKLPLGSRKVTRSSLNNKSQSLNEEIDQNALSPPGVSCAGQSMRPVKQGWRKKAVDRERRRASGTFTAQTQIQPLFSQFKWSRSINLFDQKVTDAVQIQYIVEKKDQGRGPESMVTVVQGINILDKHSISAAPSTFDTNLFPIIKLCTTKQWILALTWEDNMENKSLAPKSTSLLSRYLTYYEKILDPMMNYGDLVPLKKWLKVELVCGGNHTTEHISRYRDTEGNWDEMNVEECVKAVTEPWGIGEVYKLTNLGKMESSTKEVLLNTVSQWLLKHSVDNEAGRAPKRPRLELNPQEDVSPVGEQDEELQDDVHVKKRSKKEKLKEVDEISMDVDENPSETDRFDRPGSKRRRSTRLATKVNS